MEYGSGAGTATGSGSSSLVNPKWVLHNKTGYFFPGNRTVELKQAAQSGSWSDVYWSASTNTLTENVFSLYFNHGNQPSSGSYEYIIAPDADVAQMRALALNNPNHQLYRRMGPWRQRQSL